METTQRPATHIARDDDHATTIVSHLADCFEVRVYFHESRSFVVETLSARQVRDEFGPRVLRKLEAG